MKKAMIEPLHACCIIIMYIVGSTVVVGVSTAAKQDAWASVLIAAIYAVPIILMYARIMKLYPEQGLYDIIDTLFGKVIGKIVIALFTWYALHLGSLVLRNFEEFIQVDVLQNTPRVAVTAVMMGAVGYLVKSGLQTMGKLAVAVLCVLLLVVAITVVCSLNQMETFNLLPVLNTEPAKLLKDGYNIFTFPLAETVLFLTAAGVVKKQGSPYKIYLGSILFATGILIVIVVRNILILGPQMNSIGYFPSFVAARIINIGDFFARIEGSISMNFIMSGIIKISVCLFAAASGFTKLFGIADHKRLVLPVCMMMMAICEIVYANLMEMFAWLAIYRMYAIPFEIILPLAIWITAEIKARKAAREGVPTA